MNSEKWTAAVRSGALAAASMAAILANAAFAQSVTPTAPANPKTDAQTPSGGGDIVVTATRRTERLSKVPLSIVATDQKALDDLGVRSFSDLAKLTPSVTFGQDTVAYGTGQSNIAIRGITSESGVPTTGVYIDDTPVQTRNGGSPSLTNPYPQVFDLDRIEVLRGPQGTLFGTGSMGGAIRFITPAPNLEKAAIYARSEVASTEHGGVSYETGVAVNEPIVEDKLALRASVWHRHDAGYIDRLDRVTKDVIQKGINTQDSTNARIALGWKASDALTITPSIYYQYSNYGDADLYELATSHGTDLNTSISRIPQTHSDEFILPALKIEGEFGGISLISNTSFLSRHTTTVSDDSTLSLALFSGYNYTVPAALQNYNAWTQNWTSQANFTQEVRLQSSNPNARFNWVAGVFFSHGSTNDAYNGTDPDLLDNLNFGLTLAGQPTVSSVEQALGTPLYQGRYSNYVRTRYVDTQKSGFVQADYAILPNLKFTAGTRVSFASLTYDTFGAGPVYQTDVGISTHATPKNTQVTPKFGLSYQADPRNLFYANIAKGARAGLVAQAVGTACAADAAAIGFNPLVARAIAPDSLWSYEVGSKNRLLDGAVTTDISAYHINWSNIQSTVFLPTCTLPTTFNLGKAKVDGIDASILVRPVRGLSLGVQVSYTDARYSTNQPNGYDKGEPLPVAPWSAHLEGEYTFEAAGKQYYFRPDFAYASHNSKPLDLTSPLVDPFVPRAPSTAQTNLRAGIRANGWDASLFVNNLFNNEPVLSLGHDTITSQVFRSTTFRPRTVGISITYH